MFEIVVWAGFGLIYFAPTIMGWLRDSPRLFGVFILNLLAGWSVIGWVGAMVWAASAKPKSRQTDNQR